MKIAIMGAGGHGRTVEDALLSCGIDRYIFLDDSTDSFTWEGMPGSAVLEYPKFLAEHEIIVAIGDNTARRQHSEAVLGNGGRLRSIAHKMSFVSENARVGAGCAILFGAHVGSGVSLGTGCIINNLASVGHGCRLGDYVNVCDGTAFGGDVVVGDDTFIGLNVTILPKVMIGPGAIIGAGSVVTADVPAGMTVAGNPARRIRHPVDLVHIVGG